MGPGAREGVDDHLAAVGPVVVLNEVSRVSFHAFNWREELIRSRVTAANQQGNVYPILANAITALRHAPEWKGLLAFNEFSLKPTALHTSPWSASPRGEGWSDQEDRLTAEWLQRHGVLVDVSIAAQAVQTVAQDLSFHPVRKYFESSTWDGVERLDHWFTSYLGVDDTDYARAVGARWLISAVARIYRPGVKADCCLILEGPQGIKKVDGAPNAGGNVLHGQAGRLG